MKKHWFWLIEVFVWILILFSVSSLIMISRYNHRKNFNTYQIFLPDVDGLISGSPVRLMGIQVGYVNQIDIVGEDVYVKFIITEPKVKVPYGSVATVEFSGLGGSKSLELYPPTEKPPSSSKFIIAESPKRIHDSFSMLNNMFDQFIEITYSVSNFMNRIGVIRGQKCYNTTDPCETIDKILNDSNNWIDKAQVQCEKLSDKIKKLKKDKNGKDATNSK